MIIALGTSTYSVFIDPSRSTLYNGLVIVPAVDINYPMRSEQSALVDESDTKSGMKIF